MKEVIIPLSKSPHSQGRIGAEYVQDWYRSLVLSVKLSKKRNAGILVLTAFQAAGSVSEADIYTRVLTHLGATQVHIYQDLGPNTFLVVRQGDETISQINYVRDIVEKRWRLHPILISTFAHYLRVQWIAIRALINFEHKIAFGIPRPKELITDFVLTFVFPIVDLIGLRTIFKEMVSTRRLKGVH